MSKVQRRLSQDLGRLLADSGLVRNQLRVGARMSVDSRSIGEFLSRNYAALSQHADALLREDVQELQRVLRRR